MNQAGIEEVVADMERQSGGARGKRLQAGRGERVERNFAHQFDTGGLHNVHKKLLIQAAACNLALRMRARYGAGKPKAAHDRWGQLIFKILGLYSMLLGLHQSKWALSVPLAPTLPRRRCDHRESLRVKIDGLETGC